MKFLIDAQLPRRLTALFQQAGFEVIHTLDLSLRNRTPDRTINELSTRELLVVITKDEDFVDSFILRRQPWKLLLVSTGNIRNSQLVALFAANIEKIVVGFDSFDFIELNQDSVVFHM